MTAPDLDAELDRAIVLKARDGLARARSRLIKAEGGEAKVAAEKSVAVWDALLRKALAAPHEARASAQERTTMWAALRHLTDAVEQQAQSLQQVLTGQQQLAAAFENDQQARKGDKKAIAEMIDAKRLLDHINTDPSAVALSTIAQHRADDLTERKVVADKAASKWQAKYKEMESDLTRSERILAFFEEAYAAETNPTSRMARIKQLVELQAAHLDALKAMNAHMDARP